MTEQTATGNFKNKVWTTAAIVALVGCDYNYSTVADVGPYQRLRPDVGHPADAVGDDCRTGALPKETRR
jgi:hypothetical protein